MLAYGGSAHDSAAIPWLIEGGADVVALTLDIGQGRDTAELRQRALACGAIRAHVIDARDEFARDCVLPWVQAGRVDEEGLSVLACPLIARKLAEVARIEGTSTVAHGSTGAQLDAALAETAPQLTVLAPAREHAAAGIDAVAYARDRGVYIPTGTTTVPGASNLVQRRTVTTRVADVAATVDIAFEEGVPLSVNGVPLTLTELIESLSVIAGQHGVGRIGAIEAPAALVLQRAYEAIGRRTGVVHLRLFNGEHELVNA